MLVVVDTLRADALGPYGAPADPTPFLSSLAAEGMVLESAWSTSSWTAPSTTSLLTGLYPATHGVTSGFFAQTYGRGDEQLELLRVPAEAPLLAERFAQAGYRTIGLASNVNIGEELGFQRGFEVFERHDGMRAGKLLERLPELDVRLGEEQPLFLYLHLNDPHYPYDGRPRFYRPPEPQPGLPMRNEILRRAALYQSEVSLVDDALGKALVSAGFGPETLFVFTADHGEEFQDHGGWYHLFSLYSELTRIPLVLHGPGIASGRSEVPVSGVDLSATLAQLCDLPPPVPSDGVSFAPLLGGGWEAGGSVLEGRPLFAHRIQPGTDEQLWSVVRGSWKWIEREDGSGELFDLASDPREKSDLRDREPDLAKELSLLIEKYKSRERLSTDQRAEVLLDEALYQRLESLGYTK